MSYTYLLALDEQSQNRKVSEIVQRREDYRNRCRRKISSRPLSFANLHIAEDKVVHGYMQATAAITKREAGL